MARAGSPKQCVSGAASALRGAFAAKNRTEWVIVESSLRVPAEKTQHVLMFFIFPRIAISKNGRSST
eukprot:11525571-Alexandrium_andersonii.AAC.1